MAGDWIKILAATPDKPEVFEIAELLGIDPDAVLGKLVRVWIWADQNVTVRYANVTLTAQQSYADVTLAAQQVCNASVARSVIDRVAGVPGFANAMIASGWMAIDGDKAYFTNFDRHNGNTAKTRALSGQRMAKKRLSDEVRYADVTLAAQHSRNKCVTREEKRREENTNTHTPNPSHQPEAEEARRSAADVCVSDEKFDRPSKDDVAALAEAEALDVDASAWCEYYQARGWLMGKSPMRDWRAAVRAAARAGWCRRPAASAPRKRLDPAAAQIAAEYVRRKQQQAAGSSQAREGP